MNGSHTCEERGPSHWWIANQSSLPTSGPTPVPASCTSQLEAEFLGWVWVHTTSNFLTATSPEHKDKCQFYYSHKFLILDSRPTNASIEVCGWNDSAAMLATKRSAGVTPQVNLRNLLHVGDEACKHALPLKPRADVTKSPKQRYQWPRKRTCVFQKLLK